MKELRYWRNLSKQEKQHLMKSNQIKTITFKQIETLYNERKDKKCV